MITGRDLIEKIAEMNYASRKAEERKREEECGQNDIVKTKWVLSGPRFANLKSFIKDAAFHFDLKLDIDEEVGWFRAKYWVTLTGKRVNVEKAGNIVQRIIDDYNS